MWGKWSFLLRKFQDACQSTSSRGTDHYDVDTWTGNRREDVWDGKRDPLLRVDFFQVGNTIVSRRTTSVSSPFLGTRPVPAVLASVYISGVPGVCME